MKLILVYEPSDDEEVTLVYDVPVDVLLDITFQLAEYEEGR